MNLRFCRPAASRATLTPTCARTLADRLGLRATTLFTAAGIVVVLAAAARLLYLAWIAAAPVMLAAAYVLERHRLVGWAAGYEQCQAAAAARLRERSTAADDA